MSVKPSFSRGSSCGCCPPAAGGSTPPPAEGITLMSFTHGPQEASEGDTEQLVSDLQWAANLADLPAGNIQVRLTLLGRATGGTGTWRVRVGGTVDGVDGTVRATATSGSGSYVALGNLGAAFVNPASAQLVKVTFQNDTAGETVYSRGVLVTIGPT